MIMTLKRESNIMAMSMNVKDYVKIYDDFMDADLCKTIVEELQTSRWEMHQFYDSATKNYVSYDKELSVSYLTSPASRQLQDKMWHAIHRYLFEDFRTEWYSSWSGYTTVRYNRYNVDTRMKLHCDHIHSMFDGERKGVPTLSILGSLNDDYEGGDLVMWETDKIQLKAGSIMIFPSNFMYPHRVDEVIKGTRYSYVSWVW